MSIQRFAPLLLAGLLSACGGEGGGSGSGSGDDVADSTTLTLTLTPKPSATFAFSWNKVAQASSYRLMENVDGMSGYSLAVVFPADRTHYNMRAALHKQINASYILQACNDEGCTDSDEVFVSGSLAEAVGYFKSVNTAAGNLFGGQVAVSDNGRIMAVGVPGESNARGAVYVFRNGGGADWIQQARLEATDKDPRDRFGQSLALSPGGDVLAVGVPREDSAGSGIDADSADNSSNDTGAVYVFTQSGPTWSKQAYIKASNTQQNVQFGSSLALSGGAGGFTLAVGAPLENSGATGINGDQTDRSAPVSGAVYVFSSPSGNTWSQQAYIKASNTGESDLFGASLAIDRNASVLAVGAPQEDGGDNEYNSSGVVYLFGQNEGTWSQQAYLQASNVESEDQFGRPGTLALSGDGATLAVGAPFERSGATGINGDDGDNSANFAGAVYVFKKGSGAWNQQAYIKALNAEAGDQFGTALALNINGTYLAVGAPFEDSGAKGINGNQTDDSVERSGAVYGFSLSDGVWSQQAYIKASSAGDNDQFGSSVSMDAHAEVLAVGAPRENGGTTGINNQGPSIALDDSGAVYLY